MRRLLTLLVVLAGTAALLHRHRLAGALGTGHLDPGRQMHRLGEIGQHVQPFIVADAGGRDRRGQRAESVVVELEEVVVVM